MRQIPLGNKGLFAIVDESDYDMIMEFTKSKAIYKDTLNWSVQQSKNTYYAALHYYENKKSKSILMHRLILGVKDTKQKIDHKNHLGYDNRRDNIRLCTSRQNNLNRTSAYNSASKYLGVSILNIKNNSRKYNLWTVNISVDYGKVLFLGQFQSELMAAIVYNAAATKYHKEFANLNIIPNNYEEIIEQEEHEYRLSKAANDKLGKRGLNKYRGVYFENHGIGARVWKVEIQYGDKLLKGGRFLGETEAALAYNKKSRELYGIYGYQNKLPDNYEEVIEQETRTAKLKLLQNKAVKKMPRKSKYIGVNSKNGRFYPYINIDKKRVWLGSYTDEDDAARAYDAKSREIYGEFGYQNFKKTNE